MAKAKKAAEKPAVKPAKKPETKAAKKPVKAEEKSGAKTYHISKRSSDGKWQAKLASGEIAIKLFDTQAEAIDYAKTMAGNQKGCIRVHSLKGKMRKE
jgi:hypothetical protein